MKKVLVAVPLAALLAACGSSSGGGGGSKISAPRYPDAKALSAKLVRGGYGCTYQDEASMLTAAAKAGGVTSVGACKGTDGSVTAGLGTFKDHAAAMKAAQTGNVVGDTWLVAPVDPIDTSTITQILGGEVK